MDIAVIIRDAAQPDSGLSSISSLKNSVAWNWHQSNAAGCALDVFISTTTPQGLSCGWSSFHHGWVAWVAEHTTLLELRRALSLSESTPDAETMRLAAERWGVKAVQQTYSVWAGAIWQQEQQQLHFFRDRLGLIPAFYFETPVKRPDVQIFSTSVALIQKICPETRVVNLERLRSFLTYDKSQTRADFFQGITLLSPSETWRWTRQRRSPRPHVYWKPDRHVGPALINNADAENLLLECFETICADYFHADYKPITSVSGGMDSTFLLSMQVDAARRLGRRSGSIAAATMGFPSFPMVDETRWTSELSKYLEHPVDSIFLEDDWALRAPESDRYEPGLGPAFHPGRSYESRFVERAAQRFGRRTIFKGIGADQLFVIPQGKMLCALLEDSRLTPRQRLTGAYSRVGLQRLSRHLLGRTEFADHARRVRDQFQRTFSARMHDCPWVEPSRWVLPGSHDLRSLEDIEDIVDISPQFYRQWSWELVIREMRQKNYALDVSHHLPFLRADFIENIARIPLYQLSSGEGGYKAMLRRLASERIPETIRTRRKGGMFDRIVDAGLAIREAEHVIGLFAKESILADYGLIDPASFLKIFNQYQDFCRLHVADGFSSRVMVLWRTISAEVWCREIATVTPS